MRRFVLSVIVVACHSQPAETQQPQPLPQATAAATATATTPTKPTRICEPTISCGFWSKCQWLEFDHADAGYDVFRIAGSDAGGYGSEYWRMHQCWPQDAGPKGCAIYCDAAGTCVDGFGANSVCTASGPPRPSPYVCEVRGTECVTLPAKSP
jgi:hypothetical protein